ncbi:helix-turn-helix domain-containing protein [Mycobacterium intermedium]|nr:helix-turn-helix domain-containing protein [Mycobacterium intermedium]MCV6963947.1 helix-turn-helix domain-containing protein [Mycobacterium intermedium]
MAQWVEDLHERVAAAVRDARRGHSAQWLADETARLGYPISRSAIANYENGRKKTLDIAELLVLAAALDVPPVMLLFPEQPDGVVEVLPGESVTSIVAAEWFSGSDDLPSMRDRPVSKSANLMRLAHRRYEWSRYLTSRISLRLKLNGDSHNVPERRAEWERQYLDEIRQMNAEIRAAGGYVADDDARDPAGGRNA